MGTGLVAAAVAAADIIADGVHDARAEGWAINRLGRARVGGDARRRARAFENVTRQSAFRRKDFFSRESAIRGAENPRHRACHRREPQRQPIGSAGRSTHRAARPSMPSGRVSTRAPRGSRLALVAFLSVAGLVVWAAYLTFARAAEHHAVIESFHHPHVLRQHARPRFGSDRTAGGVVSRLSPRRDAHAGVHGDGRSNGATDDFRPDDVDVATRREATRDEAMAWAEKTFVHAGRERT